MKSVTDEIRLTVKSTMLTKINCIRISLHTVEFATTYEIHTVKFANIKIVIDHDGAVEKSISSSQIAEFGCYWGRGFITNPLSLTEWNLTMFSIPFCKVQCWIT